MRSMIVAMAFLVGCQGTDGLGERHNAGSQTIVAAASGRTVYTVNVDEGTISRLDGQGVVQEFAVGIQPTRIARAGDRIFVTLRGERAMVVYRETGDSLEFVQRVELGPEPFGVVASVDGQRVYVTLGTANDVVELDGTTFQVLRHFTVAGEPRWLALTPNGKVLYVASAFGGNVASVDLETSHVETLDIPNFDGDRTLIRRVTGDLAISNDGEQLAIPLLLVDPQIGGDDAPPAPPLAYYASVGLGVSRLNPAIELIPLGSSGLPTDIPPAGFIAGEVITDTDPLAFTVRSYPSSLAFSPDGTELAITFEASNAVAVVRPKIAYTESEFSDSGADDYGMGRLMFATFVDVGDGPRGVAYIGDEAIVHEFISRSVATLPGGLGERNDASLGNGSAQFPNPSRLSAYGRLSVADRINDERFVLGQRLFYSGRDATMAGAGAGVSCSTCHFDGRNDGLTWIFDTTHRQTPSLAGGISDTAPFTWAEDVPTVSEEAQLTAVERMGGAGISDGVADTLAYYIETISRPDVAAPTDPAAVARGQVVFVAAGCGECHSGAAFTDGKHHPMFQEASLNTPTLRSIGSTAPYLHDGRAGSLEAVLSLTDAGLMGDTSALTDVQRADLLAYLRSL